MPKKGSKKGGSRKKGAEAGSRPAAKPAAVAAATPVVTSPRGERGILTEDKIIAVCKEREDLYDTPSLNTKLFLQYQSITRLAGLEHFSQVVALYLQNNSITVIENLECLPNLRFLYLEHNSIATIGGLSSLKELETLNLSYNSLTAVSGLGGLPKLSKLELQKNDITDMAGISQCEHLTTLNLSNNQIQVDEDDEGGVLRALGGLPELATLYLKGNPCTGQIPRFRKKFIAGMPALAFLDDRPVMDVERVCAVAWMAGGKEAEHEAKMKFHADKQAIETRNMEAWAEMRRTRAAQPPSTEGPRVRYGRVEPETGPKAEDREDAETFGAYGFACDGPEGATPGQREDGFRKVKPTPMATSPRIEVLEVEDLDQEAEAAPAVVGDDDGEWTQALDVTLLQLCRKHWFDFEKVAKAMEGQTGTSCRLRYALIEQLQVGGWGQAPPQAAV